MPNAHDIFDRRRVRLHRDRAAAEPCDFLLLEMAERIADRLSDVRRSFPVALDLGAHGGEFAHIVKQRGGIETLVQADLSHRMLARAEGIRVAADEEFLPFAGESFDLVVSIGSLHWVNDLPGTLIQIYRALKPGGLFLGMLPGGHTLKELRASLEAAEIQTRGGVSPRISPFLDVKDGGALLQRAGFELPVSDSETLNVSYEHPLKLLHDLKAMGEGNALLQSAKGFTTTATIMLAADYYLRHFACSDGRINATFELVTLTGWKKNGH